MPYYSLALISYLIDRVFGEFDSVRHPVVVMGDYIKWFEGRFYSDSVWRGFWLTLSTVSIVYIATHLLTLAIERYLYDGLGLVVMGLLGSIAIASTMLYDSVKGVISDPQSIRYLVSRDTDELSPTDINKAAIETYAENLSDGVVAPLFYLLLFGLEGAMVYKAINTLDSMVGYRDSRYERFGKVSALLDDIANLIPSRITALLTLLLMGTLHRLKECCHYAKGHKSPNAGYPISAMALSIGVKLGGDTSYFGVMVQKPYFGVGREIITKSDISKALSLRPRMDIAIILLLSIAWSLS